VLTYQEAKLEADEWLAAHRGDVTGRGQVRPCAACGQLAQHLNGAAIPHTLPHSSTRCTPVAAAPVIPAATAHSGRCNHYWPTGGAAYHGCILADPLEHDTHRCRCGATTAA